MLSKNELIKSENNHCISSSCEKSAPCLLDKNVVQWLNNFCGLQTSPTNLNLPSRIKTKWAELELFQGHIYIEHQGLTLKTKAKIKTQPIEGNPDDIIPKKM